MIHIRTGNGTLSFLVPQADGTQTFHPYAVKSGMSMAANLREAFREQEFLRSYAEKARSTNESKAVLWVSTPVVLIPREDYDDTEDFDAETVYSSVLTGHKGEEKILCEIPELEAIALFSVNSDLKMVVGDNFDDVEVRNIMVPVWVHLYNKYYQAGQKRKLFAYFHDKTVDICSFEHRRLGFANVFDAQHAHDALYFILFVWKQLGMSQKEDSLYLLGDLPHEDWLKERLKAYISKVNVLDDPERDKNMPFDFTLHANNNRTI